MKLRKFLSLLLALVMVFSMAVPALANETEETTVVTIGGLDNDLWMTKYGNVYCDCKAEDFNAMGFAWGDQVNVSFLDQTVSLPVVPTYSYVESGLPAIIMGQNEAGVPDGYLSFAVNMGNFAEASGIAVKKTDEEGNWWFEAGEGVTFPIEITFEMDEQGGYMAEYILHNLNRTNVREDYAHLTDAEFANFRAISTTGLDEGILYRSSSPINPELARNTYADAALSAAGVKTIVNLADSQEEATSYEGYTDTYYSKQNIIFLSLGVDFASADYQINLAEGLRHMAANEGPYLVHCTEGKDRAGFTAALLSCFAGASYEEVLADYMITYYNYYGVEPGTEKYDAIAKSNIIKSLERSFNIENLAAADLKAEAAEYMAEIGLTADEIAQLAANLTNAVQPETAPAEPEAIPAEPETAPAVPETVPVQSEPVPAKPELTPSAADTYTVAVGDSLWRIAAKTLGNGNRWSEIYAANQSVIKNASLIYAGQQLLIPAK